MRKSTKFLSALAVAGMIAASGSAFTAANTLADAGDAGAATETISGFIVSDVQYTADSTTPTQLVGVSFQLDRAARYVAVQTKAAGSWYQSPATCTTADLGVTWSCDVTGDGTIEDATDLTVVATS